MSFVIFTETGTRPKEFISITENKTFGLSRAFLDKHHIDNGYKTIVLYDAEHKQIALHFTAQDAKIGFAVRISNPRHGATIVARSFFEIKNVDARRYAGRYDEYAVKQLRELGVDRPGEAYIITLKENKEYAQQQALAQDDKPIDLSEIPF